MNILAIESSAVAASAAVISDGILKAEEFSQNGLTHSVTLLPMAENAVKKAGLKISDIDLFAVTEGPGSFSGLRIGVTIAKTLAYGCGKKVVGISTLKVLAAALAHTDKIICPIMDARRNQVYNAMYKWVDGELKEIVSPRAISAEDLAKEIKEPVVFIGDGVRPFMGFFKEALGELAFFAPLHICAARASSLGYLAQNEEGVMPDELNPCYLRLSQAEREYNERNGKD